MCEASQGTATKGVGVLMVCLGNICRSPAAEAVLRSRVEARGLGDKVFVDSCGTGGGRDMWYMDGVTSYHEGEPSDRRMRQAAEARGIEITSTSRPLRPGDFARFRYIIAMDKMNEEDIEVARAHWGVDRGESQTLMLLDYSSDPTKRGRPVPDPYFGGLMGFDKALDLIQDACDGLLDKVVEECGIAA